MSKKKGKSATRQAAGAERVDGLNGPARGPVSPPSPIDHLNLISEISNTLHSSLEFETVAERALNAIADYAAAPSAAFFVASPEHPEYLKLVTQRGLDEEIVALVRQLPVASSLTGRSFAQGELVVSEPIARDPGFYEAVREAFLERGFHGNLVVVPILLQEKSLGAINLVFREQRHLTNQERKTLAVIARTIGLALGNARYVAEIEQRNQEALRRRSHQVRVTTEIAQYIALLDDPAALYEHVIREVREQFGYYHTQLFRPDEGAASLRLVLGYGEVGRKMVAAGYSVPAGAGLVGLAATTQQPVLRADLRQDQRWQPHALLPETRGELAVPIMLGENVLGILDVLSDTAGQLTEEDQLVLEGLCGQIAVAIETIRLRQETFERLQELSNLQRLMSREAWQEMHSNRRYGDQAYLFNQTAVLPVPLHTLWENEGQETNGRANEESAAAVINVPLRVRGEVIGALGIEEVPDSPLSEEERELIDAVSVQVSEALETARLLEETQKRAVELETVSQVGAATSTILESERLLQAVVDLTKRSFNLYHAHIYLLDEENEMLVLVAGAGHVGEIMKSEGWRIGLGQKSLVARAARTREGVIVNDVRQEEGFLPNPLLPATRSEMAVPMIASNRLMGVLDVQSDQPGYFTAADIRIQTALATQIAVALQNAMLYEEQLETAEKLREVERLKSDFLASMSHELRTPLNSIIGFADVLLEGLDGELTERMTEDVQLIRDSGQYLRELIGDILDMSKIEAGKMRLRYELIDLPELVEEMMANARTLALSYNKEHLALETNVAEGVTDMYADRTRLKQVLFNLLSNAIKFTEEGFVRMNMRFQKEWLLVSVADSGIGIREENLHLIFEQFRQVDNSLTAAMAGTGLGLPISRSLVELHGGEIWVESEPGKGTTFWVKIPRQAPKQQLLDTGPLVAKA